MPIHDWSRVDSGTYHHFHQDWTIEICRTLNRGVLPTGYYAMADQRVHGPEPDVVALRLRGPEPLGGLAVIDTPPRIRRTASAQAEPAIYARKSNRISIRTGPGNVVAIIEVVSPGNKESRSAVAAFVAKAVDFLRNGIHFLMIDLFPPGPRDPNGIAQLIWQELSDGTLEPTPGRQSRVVAAFDAGDSLTAYLETIEVGQPFPEAPLFLAPGWYVNVPLEQTYQTSWDVTPEPIQQMVLETLRNPGSTE